MKHLRLFLATTVLLLFPTIAHTQTYQPTNRTPVADNTLGTQVSGNGNNFNITGGVNKGHTLFHSFTDFSVPTNGQANFLNPVGNRDIITRVTGNVFSDINGLVNSNGANFFLINPNGIVFGTNARLNVGKAFVGSTANSLDLVDAGGRMMTFGTNVNGDAPLLSVAPNVLFDVSRLNLGGGSSQISNFGTLQTTNNSQYIGLIGGNVTLDGSSGGGKIIAPGGRVDIGGLSGAGSVTIDNNGLVFSSTGIGRSNVVLTDGGGITVRATGTLDTVNTFFNNATANGSSVNISANNLDLLNAGANSSTLPAAIDAGLETDSGVQTTAAGNINIDATGKVSFNNSAIKNTLRSGAEGSIGDIKIQASTVDVNNNSFISTAIAGKGNAGNITVTAKDTVSFTGNAGIYSGVAAGGVGNSGSININAGSVSLKDDAPLVASNFGTGNAGNITLVVAGTVDISGTNGSLPSEISSMVGEGGIGNGGNISIAASDLFLRDGALLASSTFGQGDAGKITIDVRGKLAVDNGKIYSSILGTAVGNSNGISITARELELANKSAIGTDTIQNVRVDGKGNAGDINIKTTGDILISGYDLSSIDRSNSALSIISSNTYGQGDAGKITIDTQGKLSLINQGWIISGVDTTAVGNSKGISISARELQLANTSLIVTSTSQTMPVQGKGNAGDISIKTTGDIQISRPNSFSTNPVAWDTSSIQSNSYGQGDAGKIIIDTQGKLSLINGGSIFSLISKDAVGNSRGIGISAREVELNQASLISTGTDQITPVNGKGKAGDIDLKVNGTISLNNVSGINTKSSGVGTAGNVSIAAQRGLLDRGVIVSEADSVSGGNVTWSISDLLLMRNGSFITTSSGSTQKNGNGGNITISSPLIIALPGDNDIKANANGGNGGNVKIDSQGLFGIQYRPKGQATPLTNDITASSTFGQDGVVNISTPGADPGKDTTELPNVTTDASNQISQVCSTSNRQNKLTVAGRGGLPPNANDPLTSDVVWQDARTTSSQPAVSSKTINSPKFAPPAVGWVFDGKGKVTLVAAGTQGQPTGTNVVCPNVVR